MEKEKTKKGKRLRRHRRVRAKITGSGQRPRLSVFKSNQHLYVQLIDDGAGRTLVGLSTATIKEKLSGLEKAKKVGELLAGQAKARGVTKVVFDRGGFAYHGRVKAVAEGMRSQGLQL